MVRHGRYKDVHLEGHRALLFDLESDPDELSNLAGQAPWQDVEARLRAMALHDYDPQDIRARVMASQKRRLFIKGVDERSTLAGNWAYEARPGDAQRFVRGGGLAGGEHATKARARYPFVEAAIENTG
jgi:choline-sulfatase